LRREVTTLLFLLLLATRGIRAKSYTINSYDPKYSSRQDDGSLTIRLQRHDIEKPEKGVYWLQTPPRDVGAFYLILRVYVPGPEISYTQTWMPPAIKRVR
jgi:hypothetical protein